MASSNSGSKTMSSTSKEKACYCCIASNSSNGKSRLNSAGSSTDSGSDVDVIRLNNALHELGMLSTVTESRRQYLREKKAANARRQRQSEEIMTGNQNYRSKRGFCVINMNYDYITDFTGKCASGGSSEETPSSSASPQRKLRSCGCDSDVLDNHNLFSMLPAQLQDQQYCGASRVRYRSNRNRLRFQKPYEIPWLPPRSDPKGWNNSRISSELDSSASSSPLSKDSCCNLNRSNPGSPEKVVVELVSSNLIRSRSLDDMEAINIACVGAEAAAVKVSMPCCQKVEIESMSQRMEDLHVN